MRCTCTALHIMHCARVRTGTVLECITYGESRARCSVILERPFAATCAIIAQKSMPRCAAAIASSWRYRCAPHTTVVCKALEQSYAIKACTVNEANCQNSDLITKQRGGGRIRNTKHDNRAVATLSCRAQHFGCARTV